MAGSSYSFADSYYKLLYYTMKEGLLMGIYKFITYIGWMSGSDDTESKVSFISGWMFDSWGDSNYYYKSSKLIWTFLFDTSVGVCTNSTSSLCTKYLKYYWEFIMTINIFVTLPLSHAAAFYSWGTDWEEKITTIMGWF